MSQSYQDQAHLAPATHKVVSIFSRQQLRQQESLSIARLVPEFDGIEVLYSDSRHPDILFALKALAWARCHDGSTHALVPWMQAPVIDDQLSNPSSSHWEGYRFADTKVLFTQPPAYKTAALDAAGVYFSEASTALTDDADILQEIPDTIGTHVVLNQPGEKSLAMHEVVSWRLLNNGRVEATIADTDRITTTPVLPGDDCLIAVQQLPEFRYFFQYGIANRIKLKDPEALAAIAMLEDD